MKTIFYVNRSCGFTSRRRYKRAAKGARQRRRHKLLRAWRLVRQRQRRSRAGLSKGGRALLQGLQIGSGAGCLNLSFYATPKTAWRRTAKACDTGDEAGCQTGLCLRERTRRQARLRKTSEFTPKSAARVTAADAQ